MDLTRPKTFFEMTEAEKTAWHKDTMYMCECENFLNNRIASGMARAPYEQSIEESAINSAIYVCGLRIPFRTPCVYSFLNAAPPPARRPRLEQLSLRECREYINDSEDNIVQSFLEEAIAAAISQQGLDIPPNI